MATKTTGKAVQPKKKSAAEVLRERKIEAYQERIAHDKETIEAMETEQGELAATDIVGLSVTHKQFGEGRIVEKYQGTITVDFGFAKKKFVMPSAFLDGFLVTPDAETNMRLARYQETENEIKAARNDMSAASHALSSLVGK